MKIITKRKVEKYEDVELEFTEWDALELVALSLRYKSSFFQTKWNGLDVIVEKYGSKHMIALSDDHDLYMRFDLSFSFEEK